MKLYGEELPDLPGIDKSIETKDAPDYTISIHLTSKEVESFKSFGVEVGPLLKDVLIKECFSALSKYVAVDSFQPGSDKSKEIEDPEELLEELKFHKGFAIVNVKVAEFLSNHKEISLGAYDSIKPHAGLYKLGVYNNCDIYVDPMMLWGDTRVCLVENNFYNFSEEQGNFDLIEGKFSHILMTSIKYKAKKAKSKVFHVNNIQI